jgi:integrase/recombinase XerD
MSTTLSMILDTRRIKKSNKYPVKLRVTFERVTEYYQTIFDLSKSEYDKLSASRISSELQTIRDKLKEIQRSAESAVNDMDSFSFIDFETEFISNNAIFFRPRKLKTVVPSEKKSDFDYSSFFKKFPILLEQDSKPDTICFCYKNFIKNVLRESRISSAMYYHCSYVSLNKFRGNVQFKAITASFLYEYEHWLTAKNISKTTIGMYLRPLRTIFNEAIESGIIKKEKCYPFGRRRYRIPASKNTKKAHWAWKT